MKLICCVVTIVNFKLGVYEDALPYITGHQLARVSCAVAVPVVGLLL
jgi:hypothetical protein